MTKAKENIDYVGISGRSNSRLMDDLVIEESNHNWCRRHPCNKAYISCDCNQFICDRCAVEKHQSHKHSKLEGVNSNAFLKNMVETFQSNMREKFNNLRKSYKSKDSGDCVKNKEIMINNFFKAEIDRVALTVKEIVNKVQDLGRKVTEVISMYQSHFKDQFEKINLKYNLFEQHFADRI